MTFTAASSRYEQELLQLQAGASTHIARGESQRRAIKQRNARPTIGGDDVR